MGRRARKSTWRKAAAEAGRARKLPSTVFIGLGLVLPLFLIGAGIWAITADAVRVPGYRAHAPVADPALGGADYTLTGATSDGFGIGLFGFAIMFHAHIFLRRIPGVQMLAGPGIIAGFLVTVGGVLFSILGG